MSSFKQVSKTRQSFNLRSILKLNTIPPAIALSIGLVIIIFFRYLPPQIPLFYSMPWGEKQLANQNEFFIIPALMILVTAINQVISWQLHESQKYFKKMLLLISFITTTILLISFIRIIWIFI